MTSLLIHNSSSAVIDFFFLQWGWSQMGLKLPTFIFLPSSTCLSLCAVKIISVVNNWLSVFSNLLVIPEENHFIKPKIMLHLRGQWWCDQFHPWLLAKLEDVWPLVHQWIIINWWPSILWKLCCFYIREIFLFFFVFYFSLGKNASEHWVMAIFLNVWVKLNQPPCISFRITCPSGLLAWNCASDEQNPSWNCQALNVWWPLRLMSFSLQHVLLNSTVTLPRFSLTSP